jgi:hypothetical protein
MACDHSGYHSGGTRLLLDSSQVLLVLVCDACGAERARLGAVDYVAPPPLVADALGRRNDHRAISGRRSVREAVCDPLRAVRTGLAAWASRLRFSRRPERGHGPRGESAAAHHL